MKNLKYFRVSLLCSVIGLALSFWIGHYYSGTMAGAWQALFLCFVLSLLEVSISFDNAVVNATVLKEMTPQWQKRFLTWGILIAVFGMRLVFPLLIVGIVAHLGPWESLVLAAQNPAEYAKIMTSVHHQVAAFGGAFLLLVSLKYFFDSEKEVHWIAVIEKPLAKLGQLKAIEVGAVLGMIVIFAKMLPAGQDTEFLFAGIAGVLTFLAVEAIGTFLKVPESGMVDVHKASFGMFLYLEVLDASFSFDGVIGAFAITNNLFLIAIGLGIGAMFVRSLTIMMVEKGALDAYPFLEHGAFWAVGSLGTIMFLGTLVHIPEWVTGLFGVVLIGASILSSFKVQKRPSHI